MAEFCEVMRQAKRMCEQSESRCGDCPLQSNVVKIIMYVLDAIAKCGYILWR